MSTTTPEHFEITEPVGELRFDGFEKLYQHVKKHVCNLEEKWRVFSDFDAVMIRDAMKNVPDDTNIPLRQLAVQYQSLISDIITEACALQKKHLHFFEEYSPQRMELLGLESSEPARVVITLDISKKLIIIASERVINGVNQGYVIKTAYRTNLKNKRSWYKKTVSDLREKNDLYRGKNVYLVANHLAVEDERE